MSSHEGKRTKNLNYSLNHDRRKIYPDPGIKNKKIGFSKQMSALLMRIIFSHVADGAYVFSQRFARVHRPD